MMDTQPDYFSEVLIKNIPIATHGKELALFGATNKRHHQLSGENIKRYTIPTFATLNPDSDGLMIDYDDWIKYWEHIIPDNINQKIQKSLVNTSGISLKMIQTHRILVTTHIWLTALGIEFDDNEFEKLHDITLWSHDMNKRFVSSVTIDFWSGYFYTKFACLSLNMTTLPFFQWFITAFRYLIYIADVLEYEIEKAFEHFLVEGKKTCIIGNVIRKNIIDGSGYTDHKNRSVFGLVKSSTLADVRCVLETGTKHPYMCYLLIKFIDHDDVLESLIINDSYSSETLFLEQIKKDSSFLDRVFEIFAKNILKNIHVCICIYKLLCFVSEEYLFTSPDKIIIRNMISMISQNLSAIYLSLLYDYPHIYCGHLYPKYYKDPNSEFLEDEYAGFVGDDYIMIFSVDVESIKEYETQLLAILEQS